jgi:repressor LexA
VRDLTPTQRRILAALTRTLAEGPAPTVRELAERLRMKRSTVHYQLQALRRAGYLSAEGRHRDITLTSAARAAAAAEPEAAPQNEAALETAESDEAPRELADGDMAIPIVGSVAAGQPILAAQHVTGELSLASLFQRRGQLFALQVSGDSMIGDGINDGDYAIVRQQSTATPGEIVVAMIEDGDTSEATVKRYREERGAVVLEASNPAYAPLRFAGPSRGSLHILGKLVGVLRRV